MIPGIYLSGRATLKPFHRYSQVSFQVDSGRRHQSFLRGTSANLKDWYIMQEPVLGTCYSRGFCKFLVCRNYITWGLTWNSFLETHETLLKKRSIGTSTVFIFSSSHSFCNSEKHLNILYCPSDADPDPYRQVRYSTVCPKPKEADEQQCSHVSTSEKTRFEM